MRRAAWILAAVLAQGTAANAYQPRVNYQLQCMGCHRAGGEGEDGKVPSLRRTLVPFSALPEGREFIMRVPGVAQAPLSDADVAALLNWLARNLSDVPVPDGFVDYTAEEVGRARQHPLADVRELRARLLARIGE